MYANASALTVVGHLAIAFLFIFRGLTSFSSWDRHVQTIASHHVPMPKIVLSLGLFTMFAGGLAIACDWHAADGAVSLVIFTALANLWYHDFWKMEDGPVRTQHLYIFCNNIGVIGGLVLVMAAGQPN
jgi:putative oxidoreductase